MKQILQNLKSGETDVVEIPQPLVRPGNLLIQTNSSVVSAGTEKMLVDFGNASYLDKARQQPDKVRQVFNKIKTDGILPTIQAVKTKLNQPLPLGYSSAGVVIAVGQGIKGYEVGDRVISNGHHAEFVSVPQHLCAKIPDAVAFEDAAFTVIAAIGLQGIRLATPTIGEAFVVTGLGLIGLITVQLLISNGCRVLGIDFDSKRCELAKQFGANVVDLSKGEDPISAATKFSNGRGVDGVIITASTKSNDPVHQAAQMCRKRGRIVLVGVVGLELSRADFYEKEISFQVSCSYGPGRYDSSYEEKGQDYPIGFVRWTEQRNFEAVLDLMAADKVNVSSLITHRFSLDQAGEAYEILKDGKSSLGIVLKYNDKDDRGTNSHTVQLNQLIVPTQVESNNKAVVGFIGAGNFTNQILMPAIKKTGVQLRNIASNSGVTGVHVGKRYGFELTTTDTEEIFADADINTVFITTRHNTHASYVKKAIMSGKHVFVEKPLCITQDEYNELKGLKINDGQILMVGFNRRFAPHSALMKQMIATSNEPKTVIITVNAGMIPSDHWTQDSAIGGGRIIGEACHFVDLLRYLIGHEIVDIQASVIGMVPGVTIRDDKVTITLTFSDGSMGTVHYFANGHASFPKERVEVFCGGKILSLDNFKTLTGYGWPKFKKMKLWNQDKGHSNEIKAFIQAVEGGLRPPIPLNEIFEVTKTTLDIINRLK
ncbi:bi-domain-containing oxidoreductase [Cohnella cholangitidis]|uniref:Zinc-binding dehydrogenase n=1 Tax=Cohnella cholangitidis TaxID=2598458 RepID=A0A7G5BXN2_9BACL|nr:bi-domain-containing oxidoreductase [Cohnella cholangitidis]QMV41716.1 zinc-binding dehydrogenase [Cohnella cholangitidis]